MYKSLRAKQLIFQKATHKVSVTIVMFWREWGTLHLVVASRSFLSLVACCFTSFHVASRRFTSFPVAKISISQIFSPELNREVLKSLFQNGDREVTFEKDWCKVTDAKLWWVAAKIARSIKIQYLVKFSESIKDIKTQKVFMYLINLAAVFCYCWSGCSPKSIRFKQTNKKKILPRGISGMAFGCGNVSESTLKSVNNKIDSCNYTYITTWHSRR